MQTIAAARATSSLNLPDRLLTSDDLSLLFGVSRWTIREWSRSGVIPPGRRFGKVLRWNPGVIKPLLAHQGQAITAEA